MAGQSRPKDGVASLAYVPAIHVFLVAKTWMPATSAGMTMEDRLPATSAGMTVDGSDAR